MHSPSGVFWDEMAFTPYSEGIWTAVKPAIDSGGSFIGVSTPNGTDNVFYHLYQDKSNRFGRLKVHWKDHPLRGEEWLKEAQVNADILREPVRRREVILVPRAKGRPRGHEAEQRDAAWWIRDVIVDSAFPTLIRWEE